MVGATTESAKLAIVKVPNASEVTVKFFISFSAAQFVFTVFDWFLNLSWFLQLSLVS